MAAASIRDVAQHAGVSVGTVSNVLNRPGEVSAESMQRVHRAIEDLGYVRNDAARKLRAGTSSTVGFVVLDGQNPFFGDVVRGAEDEASSHGIAVLYGNTDEDVARERLYLDLFEEQQVRGVLISPYSDINPRLERLRTRGIPAVLVDRFSGDGRFSSVSVDSVVGGRMAVEHLIDTGRRRIAFVGGPFEIRQVTDRLAGARVAVENSAEPVDIEVVATEATTVAEGAAAGVRIISRPRREWPDAIFAANDLLALGLLQALIVDGRMLVPEDIALIGFDDIAFASAAAVPLSSMRQPSAMIGRTALRILLEETSDPDLIPRQTVFLPQLVVRRSTAARGTSGST
ncbi:LacI family DNA-binding transcriptional regulator [Agromyces albus]|uniref:LacI family DNA-binding transcriptional regulator n=1 Tax=Agromyces albus TaxID=205332 RepID=UPI00278185DD|nr:LacI family DNA-binding transcriptional regulator [Agromyces albus]MDQ0577672.1 LacI family transcriptional regulator [Agromyces albus]